MKRAAYAVAIFAAFWGLIAALIVWPTVMPGVIFIAAFLAFSIWFAWSIAEGFVE